MGGSSKSQTVGYRYYAGMHIGLCHGPVDKLIRIDVDDKEAWTGEVVSGQLTIDKPDMFGGETREGGIVGQVDWCPGGPAQGQNDYLAAKLGADLLPSFRGVCCAVLRQVYMGLNPYLKKWMFRAQRIHTAQDGAVQWYDEKAEIKTNPGSTPIELEYDGGLAFPSTMVIEVGPEFGEVLLTYATGANPDRFEVWFDGEKVTDTGYHGTGDDAYPGGTGTYQSALDSYLTANSLPTEIIIERPGSANGALAQWDTVTDRETASFVKDTTTSTVTLKVYSPLTGTLWKASISRADGLLTGDMNPAHIIRECQTNSDWGMGISEAEIDEAAYVVAADQLYLEQMGISLLWNQQTSIDAFVSEILRHIDADIAVDNTTGKFKLKLIRDDYDESTLLELNPSNVSQIADFHKMTVAELVNEVTVSYWDTITGTDKTVTVQDLAMVQVQGGVVATKVDYPGFTNAYIAAKVAARDLRTLSYPRTSCTLYANRVAASLNKGDVFKLSWPAYGVTSMIMRITGIDLGDGLDNKIKIECTQDTFSLPEVDFVVAPEILWESSKAEPTAAANRLAFELPYFELVQRSGQDLVDAELTSYPDAGYIGIAAVRPAASTINARLYTDSGAGYLEYGSVDFCPSAVLSADIGRMDTVIAISGAIDIDLVNVGTWAQIGDELVAIDAVSATELTVKRGLLDTVPVIHLAGSRVYLWDEFSGSDEQQYVDTDGVDIKLQTISSSGVLALDSAPVDTVTMSTRAIRPYPPGNVTINAEYFPVEAENGTITVSWAHRDRQLQTTTTYPAWTDGNIGPESGTTYTLRGYLNDVLESTQALIAGVTANFTPSSYGTARMELEAVRDGYTSWQTFSHEFIYLPTFDLRITEDGIGRSTEDDNIRRAEED